MLDTKGPEIRIGNVKNDQFQVKAGQHLLLVKEEVVGDENKIQVTPSVVIDTLNAGMRVLIDDGYIITHVVEKRKEGVVVEIENPGLIKIAQRGQRSRSGYRIARDDRARCRRHYLRMSARCRYDRSLIHPLCRPRLGDQKPSRETKKVGHHRHCKN